MGLVGTGARTVLVVDDERVLALDLQRALSRQGYFVPATAGSGADALRVARAFPPQIVIMDLRLRGASDGIETARQLRTMFDFALIYVTGGADSDQLTRAQTTLPAAWLTKPYTPAQLGAALRAAEEKLLS